MRNKIWVYIDHFKGQVLPVSWEVITAGRQLAEQLGGGVIAVVLGQRVQAVADEAFRNGADEVILTDDSVLADYRPEAYASVISKMAENAKPEVVLFPSSGRGRILAAMIAVDLNTGVMPDVTALEVKDGNVIVTRPVFGGKVLAKVRCIASPQVITVRSRAFVRSEVEIPPSGAVTQTDVSVPEGDLQTQVVEYNTSGSGVSLSDANIVVAGGRGVSNYSGMNAPDDLDEDASAMWRAQQGFKAIRELAEVLNAGVGASRAAVDAGYAPYELQVGQTGKIVSPDLYIACGISGAIQHLAGMRNSKMIVAINEDSDAPMFRYSHVGVIGSLHEIIPSLTAVLRTRMRD